MIDNEINSNLSMNTSKRSVTSHIGVSASAKSRTNAPSKARHLNKNTNDDRISLLARYMSLLKKTMLSFFLSTFIHIGAVSGYYYTYLYFNPDDEGKKKFYSSTTVTPGINIGGKIVGGGGVQTNHHKSYFFHLVREHYKGLSKMFFVQFSAIYFVTLVLFKFFPERAKLREDTAAMFSLNSFDMSSSNEASTRSTTQSKPKVKSSVVSQKSLTKRLIQRQQHANRKSNKSEQANDDNEEIIEEVDFDDETEIDAANLDNSSPKNDSNKKTE